MNIDQKRSRITQIKNAAMYVFCFEVILFVLDINEIVEIVTSSLKISIYLSMPVMTLLAAYHIRNLNSLLVKVLATALFLMYWGYILNSGILNYANSLTSWKTQEILFENKKYSSITIENQMKDIGTFGYLRRSGKIINVANLLKIPLPYQLSKLNSLEWKKIDIQSNELQLK